MQVDLSGCVALVTGGSRGIGSAICRRLAADGASVVVNYSRSEADARRVVDQITDAGGYASVFGADVSNETDVRTMFRAVKHEHRKIDILVNNAGIIADGFVAMMSTRKWQSVLDTNASGVFYCCREAVKMMSVFKSGSIVNVTSVAAEHGLPGQANYAASKGAVTSLTRVLAREAAGANIRVNAVAPGLVETDMTKTLPADAREMFLNVTPMRRAGTSDEVANVVSFLASPLASYITGQVIAVDGGLS